MKLNRLCALLLALAMSLCAVSALAETSVVEHTFSWNNAELHTKNGTLMVRPTRDSGYYLTDKEGNTISNVAYSDTYATGMYYRVAVNNGTNNYGVIDATGKELVPMQYGKIDVQNEHWIVGAVYEPATEENYDAYGYVDSNKVFFLVNHYDYYFDGNKVGTTDRLAYDYANAHGKYLWVRNKAGNYTAYSPDFKGVATEYSSEFNYDYKTKTVTHMATGMQAFCAGCTLTADDVEQSIYEINGTYYDLQGNVCFVDDHYSVYTFYGDYAKTRNKGGAYGLIARDGTVMLAEEYDEIDSNSSTGYYPAGYQAVKKDNKLGMASLATGEVTMTNYSAGVKYNNYGGFLFIPDMEGNRIVISGAIGELPEHYADIRSAYDSVAPMFVAQNLAGEMGVVGLMGETVVAFNNIHTSLYDFDMTTDGSVILVDDRDYKDGLYTYHIYCVDYDATAAAVTADPEPVADPAAPALADGQWACPTCGNVNSGKFCPECGTAKPITDWTCPGCGNVNSGKFCPECGTARP